MTVEEIFQRAQREIRASQAAGGEWTLEAKHN